MKIGKNILIEAKNKIIDKTQRIIILVYSAKKINANHPPIYSTLNPDTNSDSPSAKSKGLRFTSARHLVNHIKKRDKFPKKNQSNDWESIICRKLKEFLKIEINRIIKKKDTS